jgi:hypothetical protein
VAPPGSCTNRNKQALVQLQQAVHRLLDLSQLAA